MCMECSGGKSEQECNASGRLVSCDAPNSVSFCCWWIASFQAAFFETLLSSFLNVIFKRCASLSCFDVLHLKTVTQLFESPLQKNRENILLKGTWRFVVLGLWNAPFSNNTRWREYFKDVYRQPTKLLATSPLYVWAMRQRRWIGTHIYGIFRSGTLSPHFTWWTPSQCSSG